VNTHDHGDHTGGNEKFHQNGAVIVARERRSQRGIYGVISLISLLSKHILKDLFMGWTPARATIKSQ
jgi:glyoxylase-like metal-dependent hydrolase (beta-lactamase superfamily II)